MKRTSASFAGIWPLLFAGTAAAVALRGIRRRTRRIDFRGMSVVISGGSRGLGLEISRQLLREGARVAILARNEDELARARLQVTTGAELLTFPCDVRNRQEVEEAVSAVQKFWGRVDVLINNAGIVQVAPLENLDMEDFQESIDVHAWGPLHLIRAVVPQMQRMKQGRIVNISSIGGLVAVPHLLAYTMGKFALTGISDGFRAELAKDGIHVTTVAPGLMRTGSHVNALFKGQYRKEYAWFSISGANPLLSVSAQKAAKRVIEACRYGEPRLIITLPARCLHVVNSLFPGLTAFGTGIATRLLPAPEKSGRSHIHTGWQSASAVSPSVLTRLSDRAIRPNNEQ